ncbi:MAG: cytochrome c oxidase subunit 3 family protein [Candidatus Omnitrophica bacterium]|nr:cytochrome c oxidase subunit 3 family protein [Candidatus Omnitrophota bacterium]
MADLILSDHFVDQEQQHEADHLGMWTFLVTEILFFGALFATYCAYHFLYPKGFHAGSNELHVTLGTINTGILLTSSLTMALSVHAAEVKDKKRILIFLAVTCLLGLVFLGVKSFEYAHKFHEHLVPGPNFVIPEEVGGYIPGFEMFIFLYFFMTGLHALHVLIWIVLLAVLFILVASDRLTKSSAIVLEMSGLYWHFVDIVWIFLFPLLYLLGRSS